MLISLLKSKIYKAVVTKTSLSYSGSMGVDRAIMEKSGLLEYEKILVINMNTKERFETYCIPEEANSKTFALYGGAARLGIVGDHLIIMSFAQVDAIEVAHHKPKIVNLN